MIQTQPQPAPQSTTSPQPSTSQPTTAPPESTTFPPQSTTPPPQSTTTSLPQSTTAPPQLDTTNTTTATTTHKHSHPLLSTIIMHYHYPNSRPLPTFHQHPQLLQSLQHSQPPQSLKHSQPPQSLKHSQPPQPLHQHSQPPQPHQPYAPLERSLTNIPYVLYHSYPAQQPPNMLLNHNHHLYHNLGTLTTPHVIDPHVRVVGSSEAVKLAGGLVRQELEPHNKVTMKLDVSWTHHSHIIGKGGNTIQPVVKKTGVSIHFPDGNKSSEIRKSNQVSINSRGEDLCGLEEARGAIRDLTPLVFTFTLSASVQFVSVVDPNMLTLHVQKAYNVQVELKAVDLSPVVVGSVRGCEWEAAQVKEATLYILQAYCDTLASQVPIQMTVEVSPQHHSFVLGRNNDLVKRIMHRTSTKITFPDSNDLSIAPLKKSTVVIAGAIDNVYLARQNIIGSLPLVLMFDLMPDQVMEASEVTQIMQTMDVQIIMKTRRMDGRRPVIIKGPERNAGNIYEAWRLLCRAEKNPPKARIPSTYHIPDLPVMYSNSSSLYAANLLRAGGLGCSSSGIIATNNNYNATNNNCVLPRQPSSGGGMNLNSLVGSMNGMTLTNGDVSCGTSSNSGSSSLSSPAHSPRDTSPDQMLVGSQMTSTATSQYQDEPPATNGMNAISALLKDIDRRAPGCEKKQIEIAAQKMTSLSDYNSKKVQAARAMKQDVSTTPRTPTSSWSGYGFSKSLPGAIIRQKLQEARVMRAGQKGNQEEWETGWQQKQDGLTDFSNPQTMSSLQYPGHLSQFGLSEEGLTSLQRPSVNLSTSNFMDCVLPRARDYSAGLPSASVQHLDITSILTDLQLAQYIDVFVGQEVDLNMFLTLNDDDLKELGIKIFGHRRRILMAAKDLSRRKSAFLFSGVTAGADHPSSSSTTTIRETSTAWD